MIEPWTGPARGKVIEVTERRRLVQGAVLKEVERRCGDDARHAVVVQANPRFNENAI
jgi:hypothetical protein